MTSDYKIMTSEPKMMQNKAINFKTTGPKGIFRENQDIKTVPREPIATDLADLALNLTLLNDKREKVDASECPPPPAPYRS